MQQLCPRLPCIGGVKSRVDNQNTQLLGLSFNVGDLITLLVDVPPENLSAHHMWFYSTKEKARICCPVLETSE